MTYISPKRAPISIPKLCITGKAGGFLTRFVNLTIIFAQTIVDYVMGMARKYASNFQTVYRTYLSGRTAKQIMFF